MFSEYSSEVLLNNSLDSVPFVAKIPMDFVFEFKTAGLIAGSIPIKEVSYVALSCLIAFVVAVLHATTINLQPLLSSKSVFLKHKSIISCLLFCPYGALMLSAK